MAQGRNENHTAGWHTPGCILRMSRSIWDHITTLWNTCILHTGVFRTAPTPGFLGAKYTWRSCGTVTILWIWFSQTFLYHVVSVSVYRSLSLKLKKVSPAQNRGLKKKVWRHPTSDTLHTTRVKHGTYRRRVTNGTQWDDIGRNRKWCKRTVGGAGTLNHISIYLVFEWGVEINLVFVWGQKLNSFWGRGSNLIGFSVGIDRLVFVRVVEIDFVFGVRAGNDMVFV